MEKIKRKSAFRTGYRAKLFTQKSFIYIVLVLLLLICIVPLWILIVNATRSTTQIQQGISLIPSNNVPFNWSKLNKGSVSLTRGFLNSMFIACTSTILSVYFSIMVAYAIRVYDFYGKDFLQRAIYVLVLVPQQVTIIGFFQYMSKLGLVNSYIPLIIPAIAAPVSVFFAKQYLDGCVIPELIEAGRIDGCGEFGIFHRIMLPIAKPGIFTMCIFAFVASWNNFFTPFILISSADKYTLPMQVKLLSGDMYKTEYGAIYLGLMVSILPVIIVYSLLAKQIVNGLSLGSVKE